MEAIFILCVLVFSFILYNFNTRLKEVERISKMQSYGMQTFKEELKVPEATEYQGTGEYGMPVENVGAYVSDAESYKERPLYSDSVSLDQKTAPGFLESQFSQGNWLVKVGVTLLVLSVIWLVTYAFMNDWIGPVGRVFLGVMFSFALILFGTYRFGVKRKEGVAFLLGGAIAFYVSIFSGMSLYEFYGPFIALFAMFLMVVYLSVLCALFKARDLAVAATIFAFIAPAIVYDYVDISVLFLYFFLVALGTIWLDYILEWRRMTLISLLGIFLYSIVSASDIDPSVLNFIFVALLLVTFFLSSISSLIRTRTMEMSDQIMVIATGIAFYFWMQLVVADELVGVLYVLGALAYSISSYSVYRLSGVALPTFLYGALSAGLLVGATGEFLSGSMFTLALAIELAVLAILSVIFQKNIEQKVVVLSTILLFWPVLLSFENIDNVASFIRFTAYKGSPYYAIDTGFPLVSMIIIGALGLIFAFTTKVFKAYLSWEEKDSRALTLIQAVLCVFYGVLFLWFAFHLVIPDYHFASMIALIFFSIIGGILHALGRMGEKTYLSKFGIGIFVLVLLRLFLVEFWDMDMVSKIITSFLVGVILIGASMLANKQKSTKELFS